MLAASSRGQWLVCVPGATNDYGRASLYLAKADQGCPLCLGSAATVTILVRHGKRSMGSRHRNRAHPRSTKRLADRLRSFGAPVRPASLTACAALDRVRAGCAGHPPGSLPEGLSLPGKFPLRMFLLYVDLPHRD